jgi:hypothetical protein
MHCSPQTATSAAFKFAGPPWYSRALWRFAAATALSLAVAAMTDPSSNAAPPTRAAAESTRLREGHVLTDVQGTFDTAGNRMQFRPADGSSSLRVLENLALERVTRILEETRSDRLWLVSGTVTEYRGENYLLITRVVLTSRSNASASPAVPGNKQPAIRAGAAESK